MTNDIVLKSEQIFPLCETPQHVPTFRGGKPVHEVTVRRWAKTGVRGVRLQTARIGGICVTSREAVDKFLEELSAT